MDRYSINKQLDKILSSIELESSREVNYYKSGRNDWTSIANKGLAIFKNVMAMLQVAQLDDTNPDFNASNAKDDFVTHDQLQSLVREILKSENLGDMDISGQSPEKLVQDLIPMEKHEVVTIGKQFHRILQKLSKTDCGSPVVNQCANMLWRWYEARIIKKYSHVPEFHYDICRLKYILYHFVIVFGDYHHKGELSSFINTFDEWIFKLGVSHESHKWIAPWIVYQSEQVKGKGYANLTSVVIWDVLLDNGLIELCEMTPHNSVYPRDNEIWDLVEAANPDILDPYINYKEDASILTALNLMEGGSVND